MSEFVNKYAAQWGAHPDSLMAEYGYNPGLTAKLDKLELVRLNREQLYEIVLWKVDRFPVISDEMIEQLKSLGGYKNGEHKNAETLLKELLQCKGIALPMASTILRFANPKVFQIIDVRAFRVLTDDIGSYPPKPRLITEGYLKKSCEIYFDYLDRLCRLEGENFPFENMDRILYQLDIKLRNSIRTDSKVKHP
jgi:hypothetical protein